MIRGFVCALGMLSVSATAMADDIAVWTIGSDGVAADAAAGESPPHTLRLNEAVFAERAGRTLVLPLPDGEIARMRIGAVQSTVAGGTSVFAHATDGEGELYLVRGLNAVFGSVVIDGQSWQVEGPVQGELILRPAPDTAFGTDHVLPPASAGRPSTASPQAGNGVVDMFYAYDQTMIDQYGWGLVDLAAADVGRATTAFENSDVPMSASITDMGFVDLTADRGGFTLISEIFDQINGFEGLGDRMDTLGADIYSINRIQVPGRDTFCGIALLLDPTLEYGIAPQYNVCHNSHVLTHETGHNLGLAHGVETDGTAGLPVDWARGYMISNDFALGGVYGSVMSYGQFPQLEFSDATRPCPERGSVCGIPVGQPNEADASRALREYSVGGNRQTAVPLNRMRSAVLPTSRFVQTGSPATVFMTVVNPNDVTAEACRVQHHGPDRNAFTYQRTDPATNGAIGDPNTPVDIPARAFQTFVISLTPSTDVSGVSFAPFVSCANVPMAEVTAGLNTVNLGSDATGGPDLVALAATINANGIVDVPAGRRGVFSVATANIGGAGEVTVSARSLDPALPATGEVCQTNTSGACMATPAASVTLNVGPGETPTFGVFVRTTWPTPFVSRHRFQVQMEVGGVVRGSTSVAIRDEAGLQPPTVSGFGGSVEATKTLTGSLADHLTGYASSFEIVTQPTLGSVTLNTATGEYTYTAPSIGGSDSFTFRAVNSSGASEAATADISVTALPLPTVSNFTEADDIDGTYRVDLDDFASGDIERFVLTAPPSAPYTFNDLTGMLEIDLPDSGASVSFQFQAVNASGNSSTATGTVEMEPFTNCMPNRPTNSRMLRRLATFNGDATGTVSLTEAEAIITHLCLTVTDRLDFIIFGENEGGSLAMGVFPEQSRGPLPFYVVNYRGPNLPDFTSVQICKVEGQAVMNECETYTR
ncbi:MULTISPECIES: Ig-like domain-containing protein [Hyphobacterium]|uniref:Ig-like domain-containing protein n=1 Tax=Hyphobacterium vulgare TaxID=1736751 RepID=A0ABV6ZTZ2_9PROT